MAHGAVLLKLSDEEKTNKCKHSIVRSVSLMGGSVSSSPEKRTCGYTRCLTRKFGFSLWPLGPLNGIIRSMRHQAFISKTQRHSNLELDNFLLLKFQSFQRQPDKRTWGFIYLFIYFVSVQSTTFKF
uniref:Uncharacterized protein n=1 Tax=Glossina austeni TaxID=7395 RepID=A0A1A9UEK1_GLOAU